MIETALAQPRFSARMRRRANTAQRILRQNPNMIIGLFLILLFSVVAVVAPLIDRHSCCEVTPKERLRAPSSDNWFGTDLMGRDVYARSIHGSRLSMKVGATVAALVMLLGVVIGIPTGYFRILDNVIMRFMDGLMAFPGFLLAIALVAMLGPSFQNVVIALTVTGLPSLVRIVRGSVLSLREAQYVEAARSIGARPIRVLIIHIFPQIVAPVVVAGTATFAGTILTEAGLSFLGTGVPPTTPSWGNMMGESKIYASISVWTLFFPGLMIGLTVLGINLVGDGLRDALDPKLRRRQ
jgi:peptide/nickel transport system permease protein